MKNEYWILNYYLGCGSTPDWTRPSRFLILAKLKCAYLNFTQRNIKSIHKQRFEVAVRPRA